MKRFEGMMAIVAGLALGLLLAGPVRAGGMAPWLVNDQEIASYTPLEIKFGYDDSGSSMRLGAAVLYDNGSENVIDVYNFTADANGVMVDDMFSSVASGDVFALGELCLQDDVFVAPYIDNFDIRALRWDTMQAWDVAVDSTATNHTSTDCIDLGAGQAGITSLDFDAGGIDYYESSDNGMSWSLGFSYNVDGDSIIGPFGGGFRSKSGTAPLMGGGTGVGITYQLESGPIHSTLIDPADGSVAGGPVDWDDFSQHGSFIDNGSLKEMAGSTLLSTGYAFGAANGGSHVGLGYLNLNDGSTGFQMLNTVTTDALGFQGLTVEFSSTSNNLFVHIFSNRHARLIYDMNTGEMTYEEVLQYPFTDVGGPVDAAYDNDRLYVGAAGFGGSFRGGSPTFRIATMNPDPAVMEGQPLGGGPAGPGQPAQSVPTLDRLGLLTLLVLLTALAWIRMRSAD